MMCAIILKGDRMKLLSIVCAKVLIFIGHIFGRGSAIPGKVALKIDKNILSKLKYPKMVICVTGSSGKGSTCNLIVDIARKQGKSVVFNDKGSNLVTGVLTSLLGASNLRGELKQDILVTEVDERYTKLLFKYLKPNYVVITNITRDQPPRHGHFEIVYEEIKKAITKDMHLVLNADDPFSQKFILDLKNKYTLFGISSNDYVYLDNKFENLNITHCPKCNHKLLYNYYHCETLGDYYCESCDFKRKKPVMEVTRLDYDKSFVIVNNEYKFNIPFNTLFEVYNSLAAFTICSLIKLNLDDACNTISNMDPNLKIFNKYTINDRIVYVLNNKAENATTFNQSLLFVKRNKELKTLIIGWREISRRYNFDDLSWLYDIEFELLNNDEIDKIVCIGPQAYDIATRLKYADIDEEHIVVIPLIDEACKFIKSKTKGNIYGILNFDMVEPFNTNMKGENNGN